MKTSIKKIISLAFLTLLLVGCASQPKTIEKTDLDKMKKLRLVRTAELQDIPVLLMTELTTGASFGVLGKHAAYQRMYTKTQEFTKNFDLINYPVEEQFFEKLVKALEKNGYEVEVTKVARGGGFSGDPSKLQAIEIQYQKNEIEAIKRYSDEDVTLVVRFGTNFSGYSFTSNYQPSMTASVQAIRVADKKALLVNSLTYGYRFSGESISAPEKCKFSNSEELNSQVVLARQCLQDGVLPLVHAVSDLFARQR